MNLEELARYDYLDAIQNSCTVGESYEYQELHKKYGHLTPQDIFNYLSTSTH